MINKKITWELMINDVCSEITKEISAKQITGQTIEKFSDKKLQEIHKDQIFTTEHALNFLFSMDDSSYLNKTKILPTDLFKKQIRRIIKKTL